MFYVLRLDGDLDLDDVLGYFPTLEEADDFADKQRELDPENRYAIDKCGRETYDVWLTDNLKKPFQEDPKPNPFAKPEEIGTVEKTISGYYVIVERVDGESLIQTAARIVRESRRVV